MDPARGHQVPGQVGDHPRGHGRGEPPLVGGRVQPHQNAQPDPHDPVELRDPVRHERQHLHRERDEQHGHHRGQRPHPADSAASDAVRGRLVGRARLCRAGHAYAGRIAARALRPQFAAPECA